MTPREVDQLTDAEFTAFLRYANRDIQARNRASRRRK